MSRIIRQERPSGYGANYRKVLPELRRDFARRCAYCMIHDGDIGRGCFHIDHFQPRAKGGTHAYTNLFYSCIPCNLKKSSYWPSAAELANGEAFCDPCQEWDYGAHFLENPNNSLRPITLKGSYHTRKIGLNRSDLIERRKQRDDLLALVSTVAQALRTQALPAKLSGKLKQTLADYKQSIDQCIPILPLLDMTATMPEKR